LKNTSFELAIVFPSASNSSAINTFSPEGRSFTSNSNNHSALLIVSKSFSPFNTIFTL
jgi:hypothetical protein